MLEIRGASGADAAAVAALAQEVHALHAAALPDVFQPPTSDVLSPAAVERLAAQAGQLLYVAVRDGAVVGYAHAEAQETPATSYKRASALLHVHAMGVAAAHRGHGVGRALLGAMRDAAAARGLDGLSLEVYAFNTAARAFYEREGFATLRERLVAPLHAATPGRPPMLTRIMPELPLDDVTAGVAYYRDVLGFRVDYQQDDLGVLDRDEARVLLVARTERHGGIGSAYVYVRDADALHAELLAKGALVQGAPVSHPWGLRDFRVLDGEGNQLTFGQPLW